MENPYTVRRPLYGGPPSQGPPLSFTPGAPLRSSNVPQFSGLSPYGASALPGSYRLQPAAEQQSWDDLPNVRGTPGLIVLCLFLLLVFSLFACLGRADFNFVLYVLGYHIWCVEGDAKTTAGLRRLVRGARQFAVLLSITTLVDISWHFVAFSSWACEKNDGPLCFPEPKNLQVRWSYGMHQLALSLSLVNLVLKVLVIFLTFSWVQQQRKSTLPPRLTTGKAKSWVSPAAGGRPSRLPRRRPFLCAAEAAAAGASATALGAVALLNFNIRRAKLNAFARQSARVAVHSKGLPPLLEKQRAQPLKDRGARPGAKRGP
ncbi:hypothetical protein Efla_007705 [Eimeria flavescens]